MSVLYRRGRGRGSINLPDRTHTQAA